MISYKNIKIILQGFLLAVIAIIPFVRTNSLYFPFVSGKVYLFRLLVCLAFFFWVWLMLKDRQAGKTWREIFIPFKNILVAGIILFLLALVLVSCFSVSPTLSFFSSIERQDGVIQYGFWALYFLMLIYAFREEKDWKILFSVFVIAAFLVCLYAWLNYKDQFNARLHGIFGNPSYLAAYLLFAIGFCAIVLKRKFFKTYFVNSLFIIAPVFFAITLFFTQTRGAYLGLAGAVFLFCLLSVLFLRKQNPEGSFLSSYGASKKLVVACFIILAIGVISVAGLFLAKDTNFVKNNGFLVRITEVTNFWELGSIRERILTWQIALKAFAEKPVFGYGPENFSVAFNKYYDFRVGRGDPWFDHTHNQFLEYLATGGIVLISFYLFLLFSVFYTAFKIFKKEKVLSFILASVFLAYIIQGLFLFDTLAVYLGLFPFLAYMVYESGNGKKEEIVYDKKLGKWQTFAFFGAALICLFGIYTTVFDPYRASTTALKSLAYSENSYYSQALDYAKDSFAINSPYTYWEVRKRMGWQVLNMLDGDTNFSEEEVKGLQQVYDYVVPELERFVKARPADSQIYYVLSRIYRLGAKKLGRNDLQKAEALLYQSFKYSDLRVEYYNEMGQVLLAEGKFAEGETLLKDYVARLQSFPYFPYLLMGHYYYVAGKYDLAMEKYKEAKGADYDFCADRGEYSRYIDAAQNTKNYQEIVNMSLQCIEENGPSADIYFNAALGYYYVGQKDKSKEFFEKALDLDKEQYQQYEQFFSR